MTGARHKGGEDVVRKRKGSGGREERSTPSREARGEWTGRVKQKKDWSRNNWETERGKETDEREIYEREEREKK